MRKSSLLQKKIKVCRFELKTKDRILASIYNISQLLTGSASLDRILNKIVRETQSIFGLQRVALFLINRSTNDLECMYLVGFNPEETKRAKGYPLDLNRHNCRETMAVRTGKTILIKDALTDPRVTETDLKMDRYWKRVSTITAPLKVKRDIIGVLEGDRTNERLDLTRQEINLFSLFANQASIIIENARLQQQNRKKIDQLLYLQETAKKTSSVLDFKKLLGIIISSAMNITCARASFIFLKNRESFRVAAYKGYPKFDRKTFLLKQGQGITGYVAETGVPVMSNDVRTDPLYFELLEGIRSQISVPMVSGHKTAGVLTVVSDCAGAFTADDMSLLILLCSHISIVMNNVSLYDQIINERNVAENILESSPNGIITVDSKWRINSMNKRAEEILRLDRSRLLGKRMEAALPAEIIAVMGNPSGSEIKLKDSNGRDIILGVSQCALRKKEKGSSGVLISIQDLTTLKKTEEIIRRMDRLSSLGQLSAGIAHEIRNPLASINFNVQMLAKKNSSQKEQNILTDTMAGVERINNLVKGILDFAKPRIPDLNHGHINTAIRDSVVLMDLHFKKKRIKVDLDLEKGLPEIIFDPQQIKQVFINILLNAVEAMPSGGELFIRSRLQQPASGGRKINIQIRDNGCGVSEKNRARIFDPFFTTKPEGTGLGLSIVHQILNQHNASIDIVSRENIGTEFIIKFEANGEKIDVPIQNSDSR